MSPPAAPAIVTVSRNDTLAEAEYAAALAAAVEASTQDRISKLRAALRPIVLRRTMER
jgi:hypothetical protein